MIGYEFLLSKIPLRMPELERPAKVMPVTRVERMADRLAVPRHVAPPESAGVLEHALFALKHETINLAILHEAMKLVGRDEILAALQAQRLGGFIRKAAFIWEKAHGAELPLPWDSTGGNYLDMFDPAEHYTGGNWERSQRFRINFNGIGPYDYCPVVLRDEQLEASGTKVLDGLREWVEARAGSDVLDRVINWAYLSETRDSYAIENEMPSPDKERAFLQAMERLRDQTPLTEEYLVALQNTVISHPLKAEFEFRGHQNWLQRGGHGALAVRYVPPPPDAMQSLLKGFLAMANARDEVPPLIKAALVSFGFVFIHPFMDGNGRLSRLLAHHSLNLSGALPQVNGSPALLPLSVAMKRNERGYLEALEGFSKPVRALWDVTAIGAGDFRFDFRSSPMVYGHWSGQRAAGFIADCARLALEHSLVDETLFIQSYDRAFERIDRQFDLPDRTINLLILWIENNGGKMPERRRNAKELFGVDRGVVDAVESIVAECFSREALPDPAVVISPRMRP